MELGEFGRIFETDYSEIFSGEAVLECVLRRAEFAFGGARTGGFSGVSSVGSELFFGYVRCSHVD